MKWGIIVLLLAGSIALGAGRLYLEASSIVVQDQPVGKNITIEAVRLSRPGRIAVVTSVYGRPTDRIIVESGVLPRGTYRSIALPVGAEHLDKGSGSDVIVPGDLLFVSIRHKWGNDLVSGKDLLGRPLVKGFYLK